MFSNLGPAFDLLGILNSNSDSGQQNQNIELAFHAFNDCDQFGTALPSDSLTPPSFHTGQKHVSNYQAYNAGTYVQSGQIVGAGDAPVFPAELPNGYRGVQYLKVGKC